MPNNNLLNLLNKKSKNPLFGPMMIFLATGWWASDIIFRSALSKVLPNLGITLFETLIGSLVFLPIIYIHRAEVRKFDRKTWMGLMYCGFFAITVANTFLNLIFSGVTYNLAGFFLTYHLQPIVTIISAYFLLREKPNWKFILLSLTAIIGLYLYNFFPTKTPQFDSEISKNLFISICGLIAAICWGLATTIGKKTLKSANFFVVTGFRYLFGLLGTVFLIAFSVIIGGIDKLKDFEPVNYTLGTVFEIRDFNFVNDLGQSAVAMNMLAVGVFGSFFMFVYYLGLNNSKARIATFAEMGYPIASIVISYLVANNWSFDFTKFVGSYSEIQWLGIAMIIGAVLTISLGNHSSEDKVL
jgi:drug/metabolite transporter (DMT)-like permease